MQFIKSPQIKQPGTGHSIKSEGLANLKVAIWIYIILLVIEGGLRKWVLPGLASPLLIVRDPVAIYILYYSLKYGYLKLNSFLIVTLVVCVIAFYTSILFGHGNLLVSFYGLRIFLIHFPLIFAIGKIFDTSDVVRVGKVLLMLSIPMTILMIMQFYSPQSSLVNRGVGGDMEGGGFYGGALGYFRPPGTFSFISGLVCFYGIVAAYAFHFWLNKEKVNTILLVFATLCIFLSIPFSISRTLLFEVLITLLFTVIVTFYRPKSFLPVITSLFVMLLLFMLLNGVGLLDTGVEVFLSRFESASESEGGAKGVFVDRFLGGMVGAITDSTGLPFWGYGIGMGTNVGAVLISGKSSFMLAEVEWGRLIQELGILLGIAIIGVRVAYVIKLVKKSLEHIKLGDSLPWMLLSFGFFQLLQGQWAQPTVLGFSVLIGGLIQASLKKH